MPESFWKEYMSLNWNPNPTYSDFYFGPFEKKETVEILDYLKNKYNPSFIDIEPFERAGNKLWIRFKIPGKNWNKKYITGHFYKSLLKNINEPYKKLFNEATLELGEPNSMKERASFKRGLDDYNSITVFVSNINNVIPAMKELKKMGLSCNNRLAEDIS